LVAAKVTPSSGEPLAVIWPPTVGQTWKGALAASSVQPFAAKRRIS
jgi:hypothetical protein